MNAFLEHHQQAIRFDYSCFDRILLKGVIPVLQNPACVLGFLKEKRQASRLTPASFHALATDSPAFLQAWAERRRVEIVQPPKGLRPEQGVEPCSPQLPGQRGRAVLLKSREIARLAVSFPRQGDHLTLLNRFVPQYDFDLQDRDFGRRLVRVGPSFPFSARAGLNGHEGLAGRLGEEGLAFHQGAHAFRTCADVAWLPELAARFSAADLETCAHRWLAPLVPFFTDRQRRHQGFGSRRFVRQVEYCTNLVLERRAALDRLHQRLLDLNRSIGHPDKSAGIFSRRITKPTDAGLKTQSLDHDLRPPVLRSASQSSSIKPYARHDLVLGPETTSYHTPDLGVNQGVEHRPEWRPTRAAAHDRYLEVQQDVRETFGDRGQRER
jgi:hypothetical protein